MHRRSEEDVDHAKAQADRIERVDPGPVFAAHLVGRAILEAQSDEQEPGAVHEHRDERAQQR